MLNELLIAERGAPRAEVEDALRHQDIHETARGVRTLRVWLNADGLVTRVAPVPADVRLWTLRNHNKNSFPFVQTKPFLDDDAIATWKRWKEANPRPGPADARNALLRLAVGAQLRRGELGEWASDAVLTKLMERLSDVTALATSDAGVLPAALERFLKACDARSNGDPLTLLKAVRDQLVKGLTESTAGGWIDCAAAFLVEGKGALYIDAEGVWPRSLTDRKIITTISVALDRSEGLDESPQGTCALTGDETLLLKDTFPPADLPIIGPTILFARFHGRPANERYGRFGRDTMFVGQAIARRLAATARLLTVPHRENKTWRAIPGERPKQTDLLLAFVEAAPDVPLADTLADDDLEGDLADESPDSTSDSADSIAVFEKRAERVFEAVRAKVKADFTMTPVRLAVLRRLDPANRKIVYAGEMPVKDYYRAAVSWAEGERNVPPWLKLLIMDAGQAKSASPPHVAPLGVIHFTRKLFVRGGTEGQEVVALPASEAMALFLDNDTQRVRRVLRLVMARRGALVSATAHALRRGVDRKKEFELRRETLRTVTVLGVLLHKLDRANEAYMNQTAFRLGQLLSAADAVHAGYCADLRGGDMPPSLLGNQVFAMAQSSPAKALATLSRRWKPYDGWSKKAARQPGRADALVASKTRDEQRRGWDIRKALRHAREMRLLADSLGPALASCPVTDGFRAELLLGYIAGLPKAQKDEAADDQVIQDSRLES